MLLATPIVARDKAAKTIAEISTGATAPGAAPQMVVSLARSDCKTSTATCSLVLTLTRGGKKLSRGTSLTPLVAGQVLVRNDDATLVEGRIVSMATIRSDGWADHWEAGVDYSGADQDVGALPVQLDATHAGILLILRSGRSDGQWIHREYELWAIFDDKLQRAWSGKNERWISSSLAIREGTASESLRLNYLGTSFNGQLVDYYDGSDPHRKADSITTSDWRWDTESGRLVEVTTLAERWPIYAAIVGTFASFEEAGKA